MSHSEPVRTDFRTRLVPIGSVSPARLSSLFDEESAFWRRHLRWNFGPTRRRLEAAIREGTLRGFVVADLDGPAAYATYSVDRAHGTIGCLFASERARDLGLEAMAVESSLDELMRQGVSVIDCQTLFSSSPSLQTPFSARGFASAPRVFMRLDRARFRAVPAVQPGAPALAALSRGDVGAIAALIFRAHRDSHALDASSSFDTLESCDAIVRQIVFDEICGPFDFAASTKVESQNRPLAACLVTWPLNTVAHVSELATAPEHRGLGYARRCLESALDRAFRAGASEATLSVTASNDAAMSLYRSLGFEPAIQYASHLLRRSTGAWC